MYGPFQYYKDELTRWKRIIEFHKEELRESVYQIGALLERQISAANGKIGNALADQLMVQENQFDYISNLIASQNQRLDQSISHLLVPIDDALSNQQDMLRIKMKNLEGLFLRTKYSCSTFLSTFLNKQQQVLTTA